MLRLLMVLMMQQEQHMKGGNKLLGSLGHFLQGCSTILKGQDRLYAYRHTRTSCPRSLVHPDPPN